jgi:hypothetical protein
MDLFGVAIVLLLVGATFLALTSAERKKAKKRHGPR